MKKIIAVLFLVLLATCATANLYLKNQSFGDRYRIDPSNLVFWFDQSDARSYGDVGNWYDISGNGYHGTSVGVFQPTLVGTVAFAGVSRLYDGANDEIDLGEIAFIDSALPFTVCSWVRLDNFDNEYPTLFASKNDKSGNWRLIFSDQGTYNDVAFGNQQFGGADQWETCRGVLTGSITGVWHYITVSFDGVDEDNINSFALYHNSEEITLVDANVFGAVGNKTFIGYDSNTLYWEGEISQVQLFDTELTPAEIERLYMVDKPRYGGL